MYSYVTWCTFPQLFGSTPVVFKMWVTEWWMTQTSHTNTSTCLNFGWRIFTVSSNTDETFSTFCPKCTLYKAAPLAHIMPGLLLTFTGKRATAAKARASAERGDRSSLLQPSRQEMRCVCWIRARRAGWFIDPLVAVIESSQIKVGERKKIKTPESCRQSSARVRRQSEADWMIGFPEEWKE